MKDPMVRYGELIAEIHAVAVSYQNLVRESDPLVEDLRHVVATERLEVRDDDRPIDSTGGMVRNSDDSGSGLRGFRQGGQRS